MLKKLNENGRFGNFNCYFQQKIAQIAELLKKKKKEAVCIHYIQQIAQNKLAESPNRRRAIQETT
jgi:hypothetical protein